MKLPIFTNKSNLLNPIKHEFYIKFICYASTFKEISFLKIDKLYQGNTNFYYFFRKSKRANYIFEEDIFF